MRLLVQLTVIKVDEVDANILYEEEEAKDPEENKEGRSAPPT